MKSMNLLYAKSILLALYSIIMTLLLYYLEDKGKSNYIKDPLPQQLNTLPEVRTQTLAAELFSTCKRLTLNFKVKLSPSKK